MTAAVGYKSSQYINQTADPVVPVSAAINGPQSLKIRYFDTQILTVVADFTNGDYFEVAKLPKGARLLGGVISTNDSDATVSVGTSATAGLYGTDLAVTGDVPVAFANTIALGFGAILAADTVLRLTVTTADLDVGAVIKGHVMTLETVP